MMMRVFDITALGRAATDQEKDQQQRDGHPKGPQQDGWTDFAGSRLCMGWGRRYVEISGLRLEFGF